MGLKPHVSTEGYAISPSIFETVSGSFLQFAKLCDALVATTKKLAKRALIAGWLKTLSVKDAARGSLYLTYPNGQYIATRIQFWVTMFQP